MDPIKEAFQRAKQDIQSLKSEIHELKTALEELKISLQTDKPTDRHTISLQNQEKSQQTDIKTPTIQHINPTQNLNEPLKQPLYSLKSPNTSISTGNEGVPTDRQTNQQTNQQTDQHIQIKGKIEQKADNNTQNKELNEPLNTPTDSQTDVAGILTTLNIYKNELAQKIRALTQQEFLVYTTIVQLEQEGCIVDYPLIATKLKLTESSIRDYTLKLLKKGVPLIKTKENNKKIYLSIPSDIKRIITLQNLMLLRER